MSVAIAAVIAGRLRHRRRDHAVTRIHDKYVMTDYVDWGEVGSASEFKEYIEKYVEEYPQECSWEEQRARGYHSFSAEQFIEWFDLNFVYGVDNQGSIR